jgi:hypothetical protein
LLVPHYDAPYDYEDGRRTLRSVVLYLGRRNDHQGLCVRSPIPPAPAPASALALTSRQRRHKQLIAWGEAVDTSTPRKTHHLFVRGRVRGGATRFLIDPQAHLSYAERDFSDWTRLARADEVLAAVEGVAGDALIFNHRILHDSEPLVGAGTKTIIRSDIIFERVRPNS